MQYFRGFSLRLILIFLLGTLPTAAWSQSLGEKANMQAAMQRHIDRQMVKGVYLYLENQSGEVRVLHPVTAHPVILSMGPYYVMCYDFRDDQGKDVNVDFYLARKNSSYVVFHAAVDARSELKRLMKDGKVVRAR